MKLWNQTKINPSQFVTSVINTYLQRSDPSRKTSAKLSSEPSSLIVSPVISAIHCNICCDRLASYLDFTCNPQKKQKFPPVSDIYLHCNLFKSKISICWMMWCCQCNTFQHIIRKVNLNKISLFKMSKHDYTPLNYVGFMGLSALKLEALNWSISLPPPPTGPPQKLFRVSMMVTTVWQHTIQ